MTSTDLDQRLAYSVDEAAAVTGLSRDLLYDQMRIGTRTALSLLDRFGAVESTFDHSNISLARTIVFRTAPDTLLARYADAPVSFEVDHLDHALHEGWSVLVHGHAHRVTDERAVQRLEDGMRLEPWAPGARDVYVRIMPTQITGRRIQPG